MKAETGYGDLGDDSGARRFGCSFAHIDVGVGALFYEDQSLGRWDCWRLAQLAETGCEDCGDGFGARRFSCGFSHVGVGVGARFFMRTSRSGDGSAGGRAAVGGVGGVQSPAAVVCSPNRTLQNGGGPSARRAGT